MRPILFEIGPITIRSYGVFIALAFLAGFYLLYREAKRKNFYPDKIEALAFWIIISGVIGARLLHVAVNWDYYGNAPSEIFMFWRGGLAIHGGIFFSVLTGLIFCIKNKMPLFETGDIVITYTALGQSIGRIGCFLNGCCYGKDGHPTQLYASLALLLIFVVLRLAEKKGPTAGFIFGIYLFLYSIQRFSIDMLRADMPRHIFGLTVSQLISIAVFIVGCVLISVRAKWKK